MRDPNLAVSREPSPPDVEWYQVQKLENPFHLWIVEYNPQNDQMTCTCEAFWCEHQKAATEAILAEYARQETADRLDMSRGQF